jgi:sulfate adenylyltransferase subunit 2
MSNSKTNALESEAIYILEKWLLNLIDQYCFSEERFHYFGLFRLAFFPSKILPLLHVDTGHNFPETIEFRDRLVKELGLELIVVMYKMLLMKEK